ncbi:MAG: DUF2207 domain-containing protein [Clostridiales bacterium]|nr:DUF2207 domain-containing protein [Clostridiales bacterium]
MKTDIKKYRLALLAFLTLLCMLFIGNGGGMYATKASAAENYAFIVQQYDVDMTVREDRKIDVRELITIRVNTYYGSMFYRSLPTQGARYENFQATCAGNEEFYFYVADNEEQSGFIDVNCVGGIYRGKVWTYEITYVMEQGVNTVQDGMTLDVIGFGWTVPLHNVTVDMHFPEAPTSTQIYTDVFGSATNSVVTETWSADKKTLTMRADELPIVYSERYSEMVAGGITLEFTMPDGVLSSYTNTRIFTADMWKVLLASAIGVVLAVIVVAVFGQKRDIITVANIKAPDEMDPMKMGKWIDGTVNNEDITSMIYYFANKGYLKIDLTDEDDPKLISMGVLPDDAPEYERTLFNGLFNGAELVPVENPTAETAARMSRAIYVSKLEGKFYEASQKAIQQVPDAPTMYEPKSIFAYISGAIIGVLLALLLPLIISARIGGGYRYGWGMVLGIPLIANAFIGYMCENYRYKWKVGKRYALRAVEVVLVAVFALLFIFAMGQHVMTEWEKLVLSIGVFASAFITQRALSRTEDYLKVLEDILGFKEFIVVTEEDKIKVMLEENPELYYKVLPYAQVLGVTDEWEGKFKKLLVQPPSWYEGAETTWLDCYIIHRAVNRSMTASMARMMAEKVGSAGRVIGRSGGGGSFGGFGGGGFGGGGGGIR